MFNINYTYIIIASLIVANFVLLIIVFMSRASKKTPGQNRRQSPLQDRRRKKNEGEKLSAFRPLHSVEDEHIINECLANLLAESNQHKAVGLSLRKIAERLNASYCGIFQFDCGQKTVFKFAEYPREKRALTNPPCPIGQSLRKKNGTTEISDTANEASTDPTENGESVPIANGGRTPFRRKLYFGDKLWGYAEFVCEDYAHLHSPENKAFMDAVAHCLELILARKNYREKLHSRIAKFKDSNREKSLYLAAMSHEIRTPLNAVIGFCELLNDSALSDEARAEYLCGISSAGNSLLALINNVLDMSKLEAGRMTFASVDVDLKGLAEEIKILFSQKCLSQNIDFIIDVPEDLPAVKSDPLRLRQILFNLVGNAVKFTPKGCVKIKITFKKRGAKNGELKIRVIDSGVGIPENEQKSIFDMYIQAGNAKKNVRPSNGTGLGLALVKKLVENMGGKIYLKSEPNAGSVFTAEFKDIACGEEKSPHKKEISRPKISVGAFFKSVLVVDDAELNLKVMSAILKKTGVYAETAASPANALEKLKRRKFDILMTDLWMPEIDGFELASRIRNSGKYPDLRIAAVTADIDGASSFDMSIFDAVLTKPVTLEKIGLILSTRDWTKFKSAR